MNQAISEMDLKIRQVADRIRELRQISGYSVEDTPYESSFAGYKDWFIQNWRRPGFTIECGKGENPLPAEQYFCVYAAIRQMLFEAPLLL